MGFKDGRDFFEVCTEIAMNVSSGNSSCPFSEGTANAIGGGMMGLLIGFGLLIAFLFLTALYIYTSLAWSIIGRKLKYKNHWLAWIPIVRWAMILQMGKFHWAWIFLIFIPIFGWLALIVLLIIASWRIYELRKYPGWFSLALLVPELGGVLNLIVIGFVAWKDRKKMLFG